MYLCTIQRSLYYKMTQLKAALFDLDGVIFDTESQYDIFWGEQCHKYHPEHPGLEQEIKGSTLFQIFDSHFSGAGMSGIREQITRELNDFEAHMNYNYIAGFKDFVNDLRQHGVKTAVVTSSNQPKMESVYRAHPYFSSMFDAVLTSEDFTESKPSPQCYLKAAERLGATPQQSVVFEDSLNGLRSGLAAEMVVVGLVTTNPRDKVCPLSHYQLDNYKEMDYDKLLSLLTLNN